MHKNPQLTLDRLERVVRERLTPAVYAPLSDVSIQAWPVDGDGEPVPPVHALGIEQLPGRQSPRYEPFELGSSWGPAWNTTWFRLDGVVPADAEGAVELVIDLGWEDHSVGFQCEALAYRPDGRPIKGIEPQHGWLRLQGPGAAEGVVDADGSFTVYIEAAANPLVLGVPPFVVTNVGEKEGATDFTPYAFRHAQVSTFRPEVWDLLRDLEVLGGLAQELPRDRTRFWRIIDAIDHALNAYDTDDPASAEAARAELAGVLAQPAEASAHRMSAVGHAHIDSAWLWPLRETRRKVARTVSNVLDLMDRDPEMVYAMSSAQQYAWLEEDQPDLFARMKARIEEGRFIPVGGMWVESDAVMPGGEAMVRQFTHGKRYFMDRFGIEPDGVWLPDSFGYSGALPQLARRAGFSWFLTQKISWNDTNAFPHHSFDWEGIDGTSIFTHFPPTDTYNAQVIQSELQHGERNFRDKMGSSQSLLLFGYGDGGGGPTREMVGRAHRTADLEGSPTVELRGPSSFFREAESEYRRSGKVPSWRGELYLELHRGTFTSQLATKQGNRRTEALLRTAEYLSAYASLVAGADYPAAELNEIWQTMLVHQFHDILPGSSIAWVHREARATYADLEQRLRALAGRAAEELRGNGGHARARRLAPTAQGDWAQGPARTEAAAATASVTGESIAPTDESPLVIANDALRAQFDASGHIVSLRDTRKDRELIPDGSTLGTLVLFRDQPVMWDAWDLDRHVLEMPKPIDSPESIGAEISEDGAATVRTRYAEGGSTFELTYTLRPGTTDLEMATEVDWHTREHLLKVDLPVDVRAESAAFETQYGYVQRPISTNTSWNEAAFEVSQHRYLHVAEPGLSVGVVNDSSYGCDVTRIDGGGTLVRLSLLRGARYPDPDTDIGTHRMSWRVVVADQPDTVTAAYELNAPVTECVPELAPLVALELDAGSAAVDWVKLADDGSGDVVARVAEVSGGRAVGRLRLAEALAGSTVIETDLLEREIADDNDLPTALIGDGAAPAQGAQVRLDPFQVSTLRIRR